MNPTTPTTLDADRDFFLDGQRGFLVPRHEFTPENFRGLALAHVTLRLHWMGKVEASASSTGNIFKFSSRQFGPAFSLN